MKGWATPSPRCSAPGNLNTTAHFVPASGVSPKLPPVTFIHTTPSQTVWVGARLNWQGQPESQEQLLPYWPRMRHAGVADLAAGAALALVAAGICDLLAVGGRAHMALRHHKMYTVHLAVNFKTPEKP